MVTQYVDLFITETITKHQRSPRKWSRTVISNNLLVARDPCRHLRQQSWEEEAAEEQSRLHLGPAVLGQGRFRLGRARHVEGTPRRRQGQTGLARFKRLKCLVNR